WVIPRLVRYWGLSGSSRIAAKKSSIDALFYYTGGTVKQELGENDSALLDFEAAIRLDPDNPLYLTSRGMTKLALGDRKGAIQDYKMALHIDPDDEFARDNLDRLT
ncbi:MAG: hypothetical protein AAF125_08305, partial [Chloroflexota bacterium]